MDRAKTHNALTLNLKDLKNRIPHIAIHRIEESFPELRKQGFVRFQNSQNQKKKEENTNETVCRKLPKKESMEASEMWNMALKENQHRKYNDAHICPVCGKCVQSRWNLRRHMHMHDIKQVLETSGSVNNGHAASSLRHCSICGKSFFRAFALRKHVAAHNLQCKICKKRFTKLVALKTHAKNHFQDLSYRCESCSEAFTSKSDLDQHSLFHSNIKSFSCKACNTQFASEKSLNIHKKQHEVKTCQSNVALQRDSKWMVIIHSWPSAAP